MAARHEDAIKNSSSNILVCEGLSNDDIQGGGGGGWARGTVFQEILAAGGAGFKTGDFVIEIK